MAFDGLVDRAEKNGGEARMVLGPNALLAQNNVPLVTGQSFPRVSPVPSNAVFPQIGSPNFHFRDLTSVDPLEGLEQANRCYNAAKEYKKNAEENERKNRICQYQLRLSRFQIIPIENLFLGSPIPFSVPHGIRTIANYLSSITGLQPLGIVYTIMGAVSIATWGRVSIKLDDSWSEPAVDMLLQVSSAGTRKSSLASHLREPFDLFCAQLNETHEERSRKAKEKIRLAAKITDRRSRKMIEAALEEVAAMGQKNELAILQRTIDEAAQFNCNLVQAVETSPRVQLLVDKATPFQLAATLSEQGECQGCITAEGNMVISKMICSPESANLFLRGHTQEPYIYENAKRQINLTHPALPMINLVQPVVACKLYANDTLNENGVTARFIPFFHSSVQNANLGLNVKDCLAIYRSKITSLLQIFHTQNKNADRYEVGVSPEALELVKEFEHDIRMNEIQRMPEDAAPCMLKAHGQAVRFAWDIHAWNNEQPHLHLISAKEMQAGIDLVRASFTHINYAYSTSGLIAYSVARKIIESLSHINDSWEQDRLIAEGIDSTTLQQRVGSKSKEVNNALRLLEAHKYLAVYDDATNNLKVILHPNFYRCAYF